MTQLREWGTSRIHELPAEPAVEWLVGSSPSCQLQLHDTRQWTSRRHARLARTESAWIITDLESKNGLWLDGERRPWFVLAPGIEIGIGSLRLVAESKRLARVRALLARLIGWSDERARQIDRALRAIRDLAAQGTPLVLRGEGDLVPTARALHRLAFGADAPFIVSDPHRPPAAAAVLQPGENVPDVVAAVRAASGGTLCVRADRPPASLAVLRTALEESSNPARLILCAHYASRIEGNCGSTIVLTPLSQRSDELAQIVDEYAADAREALKAPPESSTTQEALRALRGSPQSLAEIEITVTRLAAIRHFGGVTRAAAHLGVSHVALSRWLSRRL